MKTVWKWLLAIVLGLAVVAGLVGLGFVLYTHSPMNIAYRVAINAPRSQSMPGGPQTGKMPDRFWSGPFRMGPGIQTQRFGHFGYGFGPFGPGMMVFGVLGRLVPLAVVLLLLYIAYQLGKGRATPAAIPAAPPAGVTTPTHPCPACGSLAQDDWKHCPQCGQELAS